MKLAGGKVLYLFEVFRDLVFVFPECLMVENSSKSLLNMNLEYHYLKCGGVVWQWVASPFV